MATDDLNSGLTLGDGTSMSAETLGNVAESTNAFNDPAPITSPKPVALSPERRDALIDGAADSLTRKSDGDRSRAYFEEARSLHDESQQAFREAQAKGDSQGMERALRHIGISSGRMADEEFRVESDRLGIKRSMSDDQGRRLDGAITEQKKIVDYLDDLVTQGTENPAFVPPGQSLDDWKRNLQAEKKALNQLVVGREAGRQRAAVEDPSFIGETARGLTTGMLSTATETLGGALRQAGATSGVPVLSDIGGDVRSFGKGLRQDTAAQSSGEVLKLGEKGAFFTELKNFVGAKLGEGIGTSVPIIAAAIAAGPAGGVATGMAMGIGQMRNSLEDAFAEEGIDFPEEKAAFYVYTYGSAIGALESAMEVMGVSRVMGAAKQTAMRSMARAIAKGAAQGAVMEGVTEALQELIEIAGVSQATDKPIDWTEARRRMIEGAAAGAVPGTAFGTVSSTAERKGALDAALKRADSLGFRDGGEATAAPRSEKDESFRPVSDQGVETVRDVSPSLDPNVDPGRTSGIRMPRAPDPVIDEARAVIDGLAPAQSAAAAPAAPAQIPTFAQVLDVLPKDEAGDPDIARMMEGLSEFGAKAWGGLTPEQKTTLFRRFAPVVEQAAAEAGPVVEKIAEAVASGDIAGAVQQAAAAIEGRGYAVSWATNDGVETRDGLTQTEAEQEATNLRAMGYQPTVGTSQTSREGGYASRQAAIVQRGFERPTGGQEAAFAQAYAEGRRSPPAAPVRTDSELRAAFDKVLSSKTKRSDWASAAGVDQAQLDTLINEALKDGRLKKTKAGAIVRTGKASGQQNGQEPATSAAIPAAMTGQTTGQPAAASTMDRATEVRLERTKSKVARRYGQEIAEASNREAIDEVMERLRSDPRPKKADLAEIMKILSGRTGKAKSKGAFYEEIGGAAARNLARRPRNTEIQDAIAQAFRDDAGRVPEESLPEAVPADAEVGTTDGAPVADGRGSDGDVGRPADADVQLAEPAGELPGEGEGTGGDTGASQGDGERGVNPPPATASLTEEQQAAVDAQVLSDIERQEKARSDRETLNYQITDADAIGKGGPKAKVRGNIEAIRILRTLQEEKRPATAEEKAKLVKYVGWGAFSQDVFADHKPEWKAERDSIKDLLTPAEYAAARASTINAHYTSPDVIRAMWDALLHMGFKGGRVLEPAAGIGHFIGMTPVELRADTAWTAVELDILSGEITKALYGSADVRVAGFETQKWPDNHFDLAISNVPFAAEGPYDPTYKQKFTLHDYFFVKALDKVRPGGIVAFVTSAGTLDKVSGAVRREMEKRGTFLGAIRLPGGNQGAFKSNAGTDVTTDIIFLRKKIEGEPVINPEWTTRVEIKTPDKTPQNPTGTTEINGYFAANPDMMLGKMRLIGSMYGKGEPVLIGPTDGLENKIINALTDKIPAGSMIPRGVASVDVARTDLDTATDGIKEGSFYEKDGTLYRKIQGVGEPQKAGADTARKIRGFIGIRNVVNEMLGKQAKGDRAGMDKLREALGKAYDAFVKAHGPINKTLVSTTTRKDGKTVTIRRKPTLSIFLDDPDAFKVAAIEVYDEKTDTAKKAAIFNQDIVGSYQTPPVTGPADALAVSLNETGKVDIPLIALRLGLTEPQAIAALGDQIFENPAGEIWQTRAEYLSGDVVEKLDAARAAAELDPMRYTRNVESLEKAQPEPLTRAEIAIPFGAPWVPIEVYQEFVEGTIGARNVKLSWNDKNARWQVLSGYFPLASNDTWGTNRKDVKTILEHALNSDTITISDTIKGPGGTETRVRRPEAEAEARAKVTAIRDAFSGNPEAGIEGWVWSDMSRADRLEKLYNHAYNRIVAQQYDGSHLTFPGLARVVTFPDGGTGTINLLPHRVNAVWRIIQRGNALLNHVVGSGKTWTSIMAAMEMKRLGMVQRPMFVVPNHMLDQFSTEFYQAYPNAKLLIATKDQMSKDRRREFAAKAASDTWDGIIITHSAFTRVGMTTEAYREYYQTQLDEMIEAKARAATEEGADSPTVKDLEKAKKRLEAKLQKLVDETSKDEGTTFEELGVDFLFVDEAHLFKSLHFATRHGRVKGISNKGESKRATDLYVKMQHLEKSRPGRSAVFMTGTPVSNTMAELFTMQRYLQGPLLRKYGVDQFDSWAATFGQIVTKSELSSNSRDYVDTESFSQFVNVPELMSLVGEVMDTQTAEKLNLPRPKLKNGRIEAVESELSETEEAAIQQLLEEMEQAKGKKPGEGTPFISLFTKGIQLATDMRLVDPDAEFNPNGKIGKAVGKIFDIWEEGNADPDAPNKAQIVFLDMGVPGSKGKASVVSKPAGSGVTVETDIADMIRKDLMDEARGVGEDVEVDEVDESEVEAKALLVGKFNLYQDIKERLVAKGVPADQVAFIHEANTDDKKAKLFEKVRNGEVRVLLGSTGKMGVGTNVQRQLIAMHHLDAPWKPADVEQRDGRILRQGNKNPEVRILRYITKRSFDAYRWQLLDRKSQFIGQVFAGALGVRNAEDIDPPLPEAAELKAAATGNPLIMEHAELTREVRQLEIGERGHFRSQKQAAGNAAEGRAYIEKQTAYLVPYEADAANVQDLSGDKFKVEITLGGRSVIPVTERKKAGEALRKYIVDVGSRSWGGYGSDMDLGRLSGFEMKAKVRRTSDGLQVTPSLDGNETYAPAEPFLITETSDPVQLVRRWERLLTGIREHVEDVKGHIDRMAEQLPALDDAAKSKPYPRATELRRKKARLQRVEGVLKPGKAPSPEEQKTATDYVEQAMTNLRATSRTVAGVVDTSASAGKADKMAEGLTGEGAAQAATDNFRAVMFDVYGRREQLALLKPDELARAVDQMALQINKSILKEGALYRDEDGRKYPYTSVADLPVAYRQFYEELSQRLDDENADPVETAAWIEWRANLTDHFWADGVGKTSKALAALPLMRAGLPLPRYRSNAEFFSYANKTKRDPNLGGASYLDAEWQRFLAYYRTLMPAAQFTADDYARREAEIRKTLDSEEWTKATIPDMSRDTKKQPGYGTPEWKAARTYNTPQGEIVGYDNAIQFLMDDAVAKIEGGVQKNERKLFILLGMPGSGKSTIAKKIGARHGAAHMVGDDAKLIIPEYDSGNNSGGVHEEASTMMKDAVARMVGAGGNMIVEKLGSSSGSISKLVDQFSSKGYQITVVHVSVPKALAMERAVMRWRKTGRAVPTAEFDATHSNIPRLLPILEEDRRVHETAQVTFNERADRWEIAGVPGLEVEGLWPRAGATEGQPGVDALDRGSIDDRGGGRSQGSPQEVGGQATGTEPEGRVTPALPDSEVSAAVLSADTVGKIARAHQFIARQVRAGRRAPVSEDVTNALLDAAWPHSDLVPDGTVVAALAAVRPPNADEKRRAPWADSVGEFRSLDGTILATPLRLDRLRDYRGGYDRRNGAILFFGVSRAEIEIGLPETVMRSRIAHEAVHAVWQSLPRAVKSRLSRHANVLGVLDMQLGTVLRAIGEATVGTAQEQETLRDLYGQQYENAAGLDDMMAQEAVAHMRELAAAGFFMDAELSAVSADMALLDNVQEGVSPEERPMALQAAIQSSQDRASLASHFGATRIEDIGPNDPHPGRVLAFHGTAGPQFETFDLGKMRGFGIHFGGADFSDLYTDRTVPTSRIIPAVLDAQNVVTIPDIGIWRAPALAKAIEAAFPFATGLEAQIRAVRDDETTPPGADTERLRQILSEIGVHGLRYWNDGAIPGWAYIIWEPGRVISATAGTPLFAISGFHGSEADLRSFDMSKFKSGVGMARHGWGVNITDAKHMAEFYVGIYRDKTSVWVGDEAYNPADPVHVASAFLKQEKGDRKAAADKLSGLIDSGRMAYGMVVAGGTVDAATLAQARDVLASETALPESTYGRIYDVEVDAEPEQFVDWDKPWSQQSAYVKERLAADYKAAKPLMRSLSMADLYAKMGTSPQEASEALADRGIAGITYLDKDRDAKGARNYTIVDLSKVQVTGRNGKKFDTGQPLFALGGGLIDRAMSFFKRSKVDQSEMSVAEIEAKDEANAKAFRDNARANPEFTLQGFTGKRSAKARSGGVQYEIFDGETRVGELLVDPPRRLQPAEFDMLTNRSNERFFVEQPFAGTVLRIEVDPAHQGKGLASALLDVAEADLQAVGAELRPGDTSMTDDFLRLYAKRDPGAMLDSFERQGIGRWDDLRMRFENAQYDRRQVKGETGQPLFALSGGLPRDGEVAGARPRIDPGEIKRFLGKAEYDYQLSPAAVVEPDPYGGFSEMAANLPDDVNARFQVHGMTATQNMARGIAGDLVDLLENGIDPSRGFNSGPPKGGTFGVDTTRTNAPFLILSEPGKMIPETGIKYVVLNGPAAALKFKLSVAYPGVDFLTVTEADQFMRTGALPPKSTMQVGARQPTPPGIAKPAETETDEGGASPSLNAVIQKLKESMGVVPTQTLLGVTIRAEDGSQVRLNPRANVRGQMVASNAAVGVRKSRQIDVIAHEMAHTLEVTLGADILDFQQQNAAMLEAFAPGLTPSEQFADWFSYYVTSGPEGAVALTPSLVGAFEDVIEANAPEMLEGIHEAQALYADWLARSTPDELASDVVSTYAGNSWTDLAGGDRSLSETIPGKMAGAYTAIIDDLSPVQQMVRRLLKTADSNGVVDEAGRPISLAVADNPYKIARMFRGSYATGYSWLKSGIANRGESSTTFPGLSKALETLFGSSDQGAWDTTMYQTAGNYLIAKRAVAEYERMEKKESRLADLDELIERGGGRRSQMTAERGRLQAIMERREDARLRSEALMRDRRTALQSAEREVSRLQERIQAKKDDVLAAQMAQNGPLASRHQRDLANLERSSQAALRAASGLLEEFETLSTDVSLLSAEIAQRSEKIGAMDQQIAQIDGAVSNLRREREATAKRGASRPPTKESKQHWLEVIAKTEADPKYARIQPFADEVHQFAHGLLTIRHQAGLVSDEQFQELSKRRNWYVPFQRDMSDASPETVFGGAATKKWSPFKKFDGSDRAIVNPLETLASDAYATAQQIAFNDAVNALAGLAERAGPGSASIAQVLTREESAEANETTFKRIKDIALGMGLEEADADRIVHQMEQNFAGQELSLMWSPATKGPVNLPTVPLWRNGERVLVRLTDPEFGTEAFNALSGLGKEMSDWAINFLAVPARLLQMGITTHPTFLPRNLFRDILDAWIKTGALPVVTQVKGAQAMRDPEFLRRYYEAGGIVGGRNVAALTSKEQQYKVLDLGESRISRGSIMLGAVGGGLLGTLYGGPIGGVAGALAGGYALRRGEVLKAVEAVETMTRVGVASHAYKRALEHNPDLTETQAMLEAAFVARDTFDWNRRGSKMLTVTRLVTFLNAQIQGMDAAARKLGGESDRGMMLAPRKKRDVLAGAASGAAVGMLTGPAGAAVGAAVGATSALVISSHLGMVWRRENGGVLSADEERMLGEAYKTWARMGLYTAGLMALYALATSGDDEDDKKYQDIRDKTKATHSWLPNIFGVDVRLPKAFEWALPANVIEAIADKVRGRDPRMWDRMVDSTYEIMSPPVVPQAMSLIVGLATNAQMDQMPPIIKRLLGRSEENATNRQVVGDNLARLDPESQFDAFTSQLSIDIAKGMAASGVPRDLVPSPKKIDFILRSGGYWGQDIAKGYGIVREGLGFRGREAPRVSDIPVVAGFTGVAARQSKSRDELFGLMAQSGGRLATAAATYKQLIDEEGTPADAERFISRLDPEERVYALLKYYGGPQMVKDHPLERLLSVDRVLSRVRKDIILDRLTPVSKQGRKTVRDFEEKITLSPRKQTEIHEIIERLQQAEAWNTMVLMKRPGWEQKKEIATKPILDELKASDKRVHELFEDRLQSARLREFTDVKQDWPDLRSRILREGVDAF